MNGDASERLLHALDLALVRDWSEAKSLAESMETPIAHRLFMLLSEIEEREALRTEQLATVRHEIGNALSITQANLEAIVDGLLEPTNDRLNALLEALGGASMMLDALRRSTDDHETSVVRVDTFNICALIEAHAAAVKSLAEPKNVAVLYASCGEHHPACIMYRGDSTRIGRIIRKVLLNAVRYTPPGGSIEVECSSEHRALILSIRDHHQHAELPVLNRLLRSINGSAHLDQKPDDGNNVLVIELPMNSAHGYP